MDDEQAIRRLKDGDIAGLESLVERYQVKAIRAAFLITHDAAAAQDVVQEALLRIYERIRHFDESRPFEPYFMRSVVNLALNTVQKDAKFADDGSEADTSLLAALLTNAAPVEDQAEYALRKQQIIDALRQLPPRQRAAIVQRYYLEMSEKEMATALEAAPGTIKWLLNAARSRLRALLGSERSPK